LLLFFKKEVLSFLPECYLFDRRVATLGKGHFRVETVVDGQMIASSEALTAPPQ
jgi:hypothetical protein